MSLMTESLRRLAEARGGLGPVAPSPNSCEELPVVTREEPPASSSEESSVVPVPPPAAEVDEPLSVEEMFAGSTVPREEPPPPVRPRKRPSRPSAPREHRPSPPADAVMPHAAEPAAAPIHPNVSSTDEPPVQVRPAVPSSTGEDRPQVQSASTADVPAAVAKLRDAILQDVGSAGGESGGKVVVIAGIQAEEDAMAAVASLGRAFAGLGGEILVIDASLPQSCDSEDLKCDDHGFTSLIDGTRKLKDVVAPTPTAGMSFVRTGLPKGAAQVVDQKAARLTFQDCRAGFACTIVNGGDWETRHLPLVARLADAFYVVIRASATDRDTAKRAVKYFDRQGIHIRGCILAGADARPRRRA